MTNIEQNVALLAFAQSRHFALHGISAFFPVEVMRGENS